MQDSPTEDSATIDLPVAGTPTNHGVRWGQLHCQAVYLGKRFRLMPPQDHSEGLEPVSSSVQPRAREARTVTGTATGSPRDALPARPRHPDLGVTRELRAIEPGHDGVDGVLNGAVAGDDEVRGVHHSADLGFVGMRVGCAGTGSYNTPCGQT